jgi:hypothetical protein
MAIRKMEISIFMFIINTKYQFFNYFGKSKIPKRAFILLINNYLNK